MLYILISLIFLISCKSKNKTTFIIYALFLILLGTVRDYSVGTDTVNYLDFYNRSEIGYDEGNRTELLYQLLVSFSKWLGLPYRFIIFAEIFLFIICCCFVIKRTNTYPVMGLLLLFLFGFYFNALNISRQMIACGFVFTSFYYLNEKNWVMYLLMTIIACLFHTSAIISVVILFFVIFNINRFVLVAVIIVSFVLPYIIDFSGLIRDYMGLLPIFDKYSYYSTWMDFNGPRGFQSFTLVTNLVFIYFLLITNYKQDVFSKVAIYGLIFSNIFIFSPNYFSRMFIYFNIAQIPYFMQLSKKNTSVTIILTYAYMYFFYYTYYYGLDGVLPYRIML